MSSEMQHIKYSSTRSTRMIFNAKTDSSYLDLEFRWHASCKTPSDKNSCHFLFTSSHSSLRIHQKQVIKVVSRLDENISGKKNVSAINL